MLTTLITLPLALPAPAPRLFGVHNESCLHQAEVEALSHADAAARYRQQYGTRGYARLRTSDAEVFFNLRAGQLHLVHHTNEQTHPRQFAPVSA